MSTPPPPFEVRSSYRPDALILTVSGEIDMSTAPRLEEALESANAGASRVVVDLTNVSFVDSSALNAFVRGQRGLTERGIALRLVAPSAGVVRKVFEIANLTEPLNVVETTDAALS